MVSKEVIVRCPFCGSEDVVPHGRKASGKRVYQCKNQEYPRKYFVEAYTKKGYDPEVRRKVPELTVNGSGTRAIARALGISLGHSAFATTANTYAHLDTAA